VTDKQLKKIKYDGEALEVTLAYVNDDAAYKGSVKSLGGVHPDLPIALQALVTHVRDILVLPDYWCANAIRVTGLSFSHREGGDTDGRDRPDPCHRRGGQRLSRRQARAERAEFRGGGMRPVAADIVVQRGDQFLFIRRANPPFQGELALPGGFVEAGETVEAAAIRELYEETGVLANLEDLELVDVFSAPKRDPRGRIISVAYHVHVHEDTEARAGSDAKEVVWATFDDAKAQGIAFDHEWIIEVAR
jgi:8-oxo-dGTP diphosphatase